MHHRVSLRLAILLYPVPVRSRSARCWMQALVSRQLRVNSRQGHVRGMSSCCSCARLCLLAQSCQCGAKGIIVSWLIVMYVSTAVPSENTMAGIKRADLQDLDYILAASRQQEIHLEFRGLAMKAAETIIESTLRRIAVTSRMRFVLRSTLHASLERNASLQRNNNSMQRLRRCPMSGAFRSLEACVRQSRHEWPTGALCTAIW